MRSLTREEFQDALKKGLGRAVQHVRHSPPETVHEDLLYTCLNSLAYGQQLEGSLATLVVFHARIDRIFRLLRTPHCWAVLQFGSRQYQKMMTNTNFWAWCTSLPNTEANLMFANLSRVIRRN